MTTSLRVAEDFEKQHKDVLEKIRFLSAEISAYHAAFNAMETALAERKSAQWQEIRGATKVGYKELYEWAVSHGCKAPEKVFYQNFVKLMNKTA